MQTDTHRSGRLKMSFASFAKTGKAGFAKTGFTAALLMLTCTATAQTLTPEQKPESVQPELPELVSEQPVWQTSEAASATIQDIDEATLLAQPQLLNLLLDKSVLRNDFDGIGVLLPVYRKLPSSNRDPILLQLAESKLAMHQGRFGEAVAGLRNLIAEKPELNVIRMYLAIALFYDRQDLAAKDQFTKLLAQSDLPELEKQAINRFLDELRQRHRWQFSGGANYTYEPNINNAPTVKQQGNLDTRSQPESAHGVSYRLGAEKDWALPHGFTAKFSTDIHGKHYPAHKQYNDLLVNTAAGIGYRNARFDAEIMPFVSKRWWRGGKEESGLKPYSESFGATLGISTRFDRRWRLNQYARIEKINHEHRFRFDGIRRQTGHTLIYQSNPRQAWFGGLDFQRETLHDPDNSNHQWTASLGWIQEWPKGFSTRTRAAWSKQTYHAPMPWPIQKTRKDRSLQLNLSVWHRNIHFWGITPRITWQHTRNKSNVFLYDYRKQNMFVEFSKTF